MLRTVGTASHATLSSELHDCTLKLPLNAHPTHVFEQLGGVGDAMRVKRRREPRSLPPHLLLFILLSPIYICRVCVAIDIKSCEFFSLCVNASGVCGVA